MVAHLIVGNPIGTKRKASRRRHLSPKQIAAGFGGKRRKSSTKRASTRTHKRRTNPMAQRRVEHVATPHAL